MTMTMRKARASFASDVTPVNAKVAKAKGDGKGPGKDRGGQAGGGKGALNQNVPNFMHDKAVLDVSNKYPQGRKYCFNSHGPPVYRQPKQVERPQQWGPELPEDPIEEGEEFRGNKQCGAPPVRAQEGNPWTTTSLSDF